MNNTQLTGIYLGSRGDDFKTSIANVLKKGKICKKYAKVLLSDESMRMYESAFTSDLIDDLNNYQVYEQIGDLSCNKFIVYYFYKRFPQLKCSEGVKVVARLRINYGSKDTFSKLAESFGFWDFISATNDSRSKKRKDLLEDVFEAFIGVTEIILDEKIRHGVGYSCVYKILEGIFNEIPISLQYEDLYDAKTRLKEVFDIFSEQIGTLKYEESKETKDDNVTTTSSIYRILGNAKIRIASATAPLKMEAEQMASSDAISAIARLGYEKKTPSVYAKLSGENKENKEVMRIIGGDETKINDQFFTKGKPKYQNKYTSTALIYCCKKKDYSGIKKCLTLGADPNIPDSEGLTAGDCILIGSEEHTVIVKKSIKKMLKTIETNLKIHSNVYNTYYERYGLKKKSRIELIE